MESAKKAFKEGKLLLDRVMNYEEGLRNNKHLSKSHLEKIGRLAIMNSIMTAKVQMFGENSIVKINKANSLYCLPAFDVDKKV